MSQDPFSDPSYRVHPFQDTKLDPAQESSCSRSWSEADLTSIPLKLAELVGPFAAIGCDRVFRLELLPAEIRIAHPVVPGKAWVSISLLSDGYRKCSLHFADKEPRSIVSDYPDRDPAAMAWLDLLARYDH